jgi:hypothetical protein
MPRVQLVHLAHARSGDKGDTANVGVIAYDPAHYPLLVREVTTGRVKAHFGALVNGPVERFELPNLHALNFLLHNALDGGGTVSLMNDAQGKVMSTALLRMEVEVPEEVAKAVMGKGRAPAPTRPVEAHASGAGGGVAGESAPGQRSGARGTPAKGPGGSGPPTGRRPA